MRRTPSDDALMPGRVATQTEADHYWREKVLAADPRPAATLAIVIALLALLL